MKRLKNLLYKPWSAYTIATCSAVLLYFLLSHLSSFASFFGSVKSVLAPAIIGLIIAYLLHPVSDFFENRVFKKIKKKSVKHTLSVIITVIIILALLSVLIAALIPSLISSVSNLIENKDRYISSIEGFLLKFNSKLFKFDVSNLTETVDNAVNNIINTLYNNMSTVLSTLKGVGTGVSNFALGFVFAVCFMLGKDSLLRLVKRIRMSYMPETRYNSTTAFWSRCNDIFTKYLGCTVVDGVIIGILNAIFMTVTGLPYVTLISVIVGFTNLIPTVGPIIGGALGAFILVLNKPVYALYFLIFTVAVQAVDSMIIKPKLFSGSLGLPAIWSIIAITIGGKIAGIAGIILSIPVATIMLLSYKEFAVPWFEKRKAKLGGAEELPQTELQTETEAENLPDAQEKTPKEEKK